jgi:predicted kinase
MPKLIVLCGPPGSGKDTYIENNLKNYKRISQDDHGKQHLDYFHVALGNSKDIVVSRMNFNKQQRERYLKPAKEAGYETEIVVLHQNRATCLKRCNARIGHPTIQDEKSAQSALDTFFTRYERPTFDEADIVTFKYPEFTMQLPVILVDIDGTAANIEHRLHHVNPTEGKKKNWAAFNAEISKDSVNEWCKTLVKQFYGDTSIVFCSGRTDSLRKETEAWLKTNGYPYDELFMRHRSDSRKDDLVKEILLDFEIKTRYSRIIFVVDDRPSVCRKWRSRGLTVLQCNDTEF